MTRFERDILEYLEMYQVFPVVTTSEVHDLRKRIKVMARADKAVKTSKPQDSAPCESSMADICEHEFANSSKNDGKLDNSVGEYIVSFDASLFSKYLNAHDIRVDERKTIEQLQKTYEPRRKGLAIKYQSNPQAFYTLYCKDLGLPLSEVQWLCEGPAFGKILYDEMGVRSTTYSEYNFGRALDVLEEAESRGETISECSNLFWLYDRNKLSWFLSPEGLAAVAELEECNKKFSRRHIQFQLYCADLQLEICQNRLWDETQ